MVIVQSAQTNETAVTGTTITPAAFPAGSTQVLPAADKPCGCGGHGKKRMPVFDLFELAILLWVVLIIMMIVLTYKRIKAA